MGITLFIMRSKPRFIGHQQHRRKGGSRRHCSKRTTLPDAIG